MKNMGGKLNKGENMANIDGEEIENISDDKLKKLIQIYREAPPTDEVKETLEALENELRSRG